MSGRVGISAPDEHLRRVTGDQMLQWWDTLSEDDRDLLRATSDAIAGNQPALAWLAWMGCPLVITTERATEPYVLCSAHQLQNFLAQM